MSKSVITDSLLTGIADAIRAKTGGQASMTPAEMAQEIADMPSGAPEHYVEYILDSTSPGELVKEAVVSGLKTIRHYEFYNCLGLTNISLPSDLRSIGDSAFYGDLVLRLSELPAGVTSIGQKAFYNCALITLSELPAGITAIPSDCFHGCAGITLSELPAGVTSIGANAFNGCNSIALSELPAGVTSIGANAFQGCRLITALSCAGTITSLGNTIFGNDLPNNNVASVRFPNANLSSLGLAFGYSSANYACQKLHTLDIGTTKAISANALKNCYSLEKLVLRRTDAVCTLSAVTAFDNTPFSGYDGGTGTVYVPSALISTYRTATNWSSLYGGGHLQFAAIEGSEFEI